MKSPESAGLRVEGWKSEPDEMRMSYLPPLGPADGLDDAPQQLPGGRGEQPGELGVEGGPLPDHQLPGGLLGGGEGQLPVLAGQNGEEEGEAGAQLLLLLALGQQLQCPGVVWFGEVLSLEKFWVW